MHRLCLWPTLLWLLVRSGSARTSWAPSALCRCSDHASGGTFRRCWQLTWANVVEAAGLVHTEHGALGQGA